MNTLDAIQQSSGVLWFFFATFGLIVGSFLNVVIARLPLIIDSEWRELCQNYFNATGRNNESPPEKTFNLAFPRSHCPSCKKTIPFFDNIPVLSFLWLKAKCRFCKASIHWQYPLIEILTMIIWLVVYSVYGLSLETIVHGTVITAFLALSVIDFKTMLLPDEITQPLLWFCLFTSVIGRSVSPESAILGAIFGYGSLWSIYIIFKALTGKEGMGYGDFKLLAAIGAWLGWQSLPLIVFLSALIGLIVGLMLIARKKLSAEKAIPFGPYLALAATIDLFYHDSILLLYWRWVI